jgi:hypothetical protein
MSFFEWITGTRPKDRAIDSHLITVNARLSIENDAEEKFANAIEKLSDEEKEEVENKSQEFLKITGFIFPRRSDYLDHKRYIAEEILKKRCVFVSNDVARGEK